MKDGFLDISAIASKLKYCAKTNSLRHGTLLHEQIIANGLDTDTFVGNWIIQMYGDCGNPSSAQEAFQRIRNPNLYSWNILINALGQNGKLQDAISSFKKMPCRDVVSWNAIIKSYAQHGYRYEALQWFSQMQLEDMKPSAISYVCALNAAAGLTAFVEGEKIFSDIVKNEHWYNVVVGNAILDMYSKCGRIDEARLIFAKMPYRNVVSWTTIIASYSHNEEGDKALYLFGEMLLQGFEPETIAYGCVIDACTGISAFFDGQIIHAASVYCGFEENVMVGSALINLYAKFGYLLEAGHSFSQIEAPNVISWTSMISAYIQYDCFWAGLILFHEMVIYGVKPDRVTFLSIIELCANLGVLEQGKMIHHSVLEAGCEEVLEVGNALIDMYGKCGGISDAEGVFKSMPFHDIVSWNAMLATYAHNGNDEDTLSYFHNMHHDGIEPNAITYLLALTTCSHSGLSNIGRHLFLYLHTHGVPMLTVDQSACMVDLLGRSGCLDEAEALINTLPFDKGSVTAWLCLLSACRLHGDIDRGARLARFCFELEPKNVAPYKVLSNMLQT